MAPDRTPPGGQERRCPSYGFNPGPHPCGAGFTPANGGRTDTTAGTAAPLAGINPAPQISTTRPHGPVALQGGQRFPARRWRPTATPPGGQGRRCPPYGSNHGPHPCGAGFTPANGARTDTTDRDRGPAGRDKPGPTDFHHPAARTGSPVGRTALSCPPMAPDRTPPGGQERRCPPYGFNPGPHPCGAGFTPANGARTDTTD